MRSKIYLPGKPGTYENFRKAIEFMLSRDFSLEPAGKYEIDGKEVHFAVPKDSPYASRTSVELAEMKDESFVMLSSSRLFGAICERLCLSAGFAPKIFFESDSPVAVQNIIGMGAGAAFWPEYSWGKAKNKNIALIGISDPVCRRDLIFELYERIPSSGYAEEFYEFMLKII